MKKNKQGVQFGILDCANSDPVAISETLQQELIKKAPSLSSTKIRCASQCGDST